MFQTEVEFSLPLGYVDSDGNIHRDGTMRLATAGDEIMPLNDPRVQKNPAYLVLILLSRVVMRLEGVAQITPKVIESLFASDLAYLQALYNKLNSVENGHAPATCPNCEHVFQVEMNGLGG